MLRSAVVLAVAAVLQVPASSQADDGTTASEQRSDRSAAVAEAAATGTRVEIESARTSSSATFANPDGTLTFEAYSGGPASGDTWVQSANPQASQHTSPELRVGTTNIGITKARSYLSFDTSALDAEPGWIVDASVELSNFTAGSCSGSPIRLSRVTSAWTEAGITWATQPATTATGSSINATAHGANGCATEGTVEFDATPIVASWAAGIDNHGLQLKADKEGANASWRKYRSLEAAAPAAAPKLTVVISRPPATPTDLVITPRTGDYVTSATPTLSAVVSDPDGGEVAGRFEITSGIQTVWTGTSTTVASGEAATIVVPAGVLEDGKIYTVAARGVDPYGMSSADPVTRIVAVDTIAPTVAISSAQVSDGTWTADVPEAVTILLDSPPGTGGFDIDYDGVEATLGASSAGDRELVFQPTPGWHVLVVTPFDLAGNVGDPVTFSFGIGTAPAISATVDVEGEDGWSLAGSRLTLTVTGSGDPDAEYRIGEGAWTSYAAPVPLPEGRYDVSWRLLQGEDVVEEDSTSVKADATVPTAAAEVNGRQVTVTATDPGADDASGVASTEVRVDGGAWTPYTAALVLDDGAHVVAFRATDVAGNTSTVGQVSLAGIAPVLVNAPVVTGTARYGERLSATAGSWDQSVTTAVQWLRNGTPIAGATGSSYRLALLDLGARLSVRVTASAPGRPSGTATSAASPVVAKALSRTAVKVAPTVVSKGGTMTVLVVVSSATASPSGRVQVTIAGRTVTKTLASGRVKFTVKATVRGTQKVTVRYLGSRILGTSTATTGFRVR